jgi:cell division transport system permease protein
VAFISLLAAVLLVLNTIRVAIFARRREVAVMKLVGATNWFIRIPFMLEGLLQGLIGALAAFGLVAAANNYFKGAIKTVPLFGTFTVSSSQVLTTGIGLLILGTLVGAIGSAIAVSRFLDV